MTPAGPGTPYAATITSVTIPYVLSGSPGVSFIRLGLATALAFGDTGTIAYTPGIHPPRTVEPPNTAADPFDTSLSLLDNPTFEAPLAMADEGLGPNHIVIVLTHHSERRCLRRRISR